MKRIAAAIVGCGKMGSHHVRILSELEQVDLKAICDSNIESTKSLAKKFFVDKVYDNVDVLLEKEEIDVVSIAVPTVLHFKIVKKFLERGIHVLIEKPLASSIEECEDLLVIAKKKKIVLFPGHIERYNPVIMQINEFLEKNFLGKIYYVETVRAGPFPKRLYGNNDGIIIDLAVHDLDLISYIFGNITQLFAHHIVTEKHDQDIYARLMFKTINNVVGSSEFSWISPRKERKISIYGDKGILVGDLVNQEVWYYENGDQELYTKEEYYQGALLGQVSEGKVIKYPINKSEPLKNEITFFLQLINMKKWYDSSYGRNAVEYANAIIDSAKENRIIFFNK